MRAAKVASAPLPDNAPHVLIVDDDQKIRDLLGRYLSEQGFRVTTAQDAASARAGMRGLEFDAVLLDVMMPGENGLDLARELKATRSIPICMLTARSDPEHRIEGLEAGVDDYLPKPVRAARIAAAPAQHPASGFRCRGPQRRGAPRQSRVPRFARRAEAP